MIFAKDHKTLDMFDPLAHFGPHRRKWLEKSWARLFREEILPELPVHKLRPFFSESKGAPTKDLYAMLGIALLQQMHDLTDEETIDRVAFDLKWHFALNLSEGKAGDVYVCPKTLLTLRHLLSGNDLSGLIFQTATEKLAKLFSIDPSWQRLDSTTRGSRGMEARQQRYLFKLKQSKNVRRLLLHQFQRHDWVDADQGWEAVEDEIKLAGWMMARRVVILRRPVKKELALARQKGMQVEMLFPDDAGTMCYEYAVLVAGCPVDTAAIAQLSRDRADAENGFDELKNQWGWGGYTTRDIARCRLTARMVELVYNWWSWYNRMARPSPRLEAITSRPLLLAAIGRTVRHSGQNHLYLTPMHAAGRVIAAMTDTIRAGLQHVKHIAEQLPSRDRWELLVRYIVERILASAQAIRRNQPVLPAPAAG